MPITFGTVVIMYFTPEYTQPAGSIRTHALIQGVKFASVEQFKNMLIGGLNEGGDEEDKNDNVGGVALGKHRIWQLSC